MLPNLKWVHFGGLDAYCSSCFVLLGYRFLAKSLEMGNNPASASNQKKWPNKRMATGSPKGEFLIRKLAKIIRRRIRGC
jgi:hypothetical protein